MTVLPEFRLETYFARWEFTARHHLTASDAQTRTVTDLLALADEQDLAAWRDLDLGYRETWGDPLLREAIASGYTGLDAGEVLCFAGAEEAIYLALTALLGPGDHAVVVTPGYQSAETVPLSRCEVTGVALDPERNWALDVDAVLDAVRPNTVLVAVNFPNNPTGALVEPAEFRRLLAECDARGVRVFSDEVYRGLELDPARTLPQAAELSPRALSVGVTSKSLGLPGLRVGWIACQDRELLSTLERAKHYTTICNAGPSEVLARIAIKARERILTENRALIAANLPVFQDFFAEFAELFEFAPPEGGCVCFPRYLGTEGATEFCRRAVEEVGVLLVPGEVFASRLTPVPADRFRIGVGRRDPEPALDALRGWIRSTRNVQALRADDGEQSQRLLGG
ncbi:pyridoxal phosphate-dependent aminotransferase [Kutzneria viridogrisea]|uniref:Aspartate/methionine/tyrosine aminotransferase n=1 Tax=Kutzneria viridogrisea TaxID=47990 RepID=A0ABR6BD26_9PSEU|nr:aspartate/methionine/tyrosine aminotransferase [Kutzneria viridogrisea]